MLGLQALCTEGQVMLAVHHCAGRCTNLEKLLDDLSEEVG